jgi:hypothetical protein
VSLYDDLSDKRGLMSKFLVVLLMSGLLWPWSASAAEDSELMPTEQKHDDVRLETAPETDGHGIDVAEEEEEEENIDEAPVVEQVDDAADGDVLQKPTSATEDSALLPDVHLGTAPEADGHGIDVAVDDAADGDARQKPTSATEDSALLPNAHLGTAPETDGHRIDVAEKEEGNIDDEPIIKSSTAPSQDEQADSGSPLERLNRLKERLEAEDHSRQSFDTDGQDELPVRGGFGELVQRAKQMKQIKQARKSRGTTSKSKPG